MATLKEKIGYGFGDMSSSMFWKIFSYYLPFFYSNIFGLSLADAGLLMLVTRIWDAVSDPMMGVIADRTHTRWGKYRPYLLWIAAPFAIAGILLFTTPDMGTTGKLVWAYVTYILMMTVYTAINVPYGAMLGVMTDDSNTKTVFSSYRMFFAYGGSFIALGAWEPLCNWFKSMDYSNASSWQYAMVCIATLCFLGFLFCFSMTREHVKSVASESIGKDVKSLVRNSPWWILNGAALLSNFFNTVRGATAAYFFKDYISANAFLDFGVFNLVLYAGLFLMVGEVCNMIGVALAVPLSMKFGKKSTYIISLVCLVVLSVLFFFVPNDGMVADDDFPGAYLHLHRYRISVDLEHVCGCGGLCRAKGWHILYGADILFRFYGAEVWRCICRLGSNGTVGILRLQYRRECRADSRGAGWLEVSDELYSCCDSRTFHRCRIHLSIE